MRKLTYLIPLICLFIISSCNKQEEYNSTPVCRILLPNDNNVFVPGEKVKIKVDAYDEEGDLQEVTLSINGEVEHTFTAPPYEMVWETKGKQIGNYTIEAKAVDKGGKEKVHEMTLKLSLGLIYNNNFYHIDAGALFNYGRITPTSFHLNLLLASNSMLTVNKGELIIISIYSSHSYDLEPGAYSYNSSQKENTFDAGECLVDFNMDTNTGTDVLITAGEIEIGMSGDKYQISLNCISDASIPIIVYFEGFLEYYDQTKKSFNKRDAIKEMRYNH